MNVTVMSRANAVRYCRQKNPEPTAIISISDPYMGYADEPFCSEENKIRGILNLRFADADGAGIDVYGRNVEESDLMTDEDARKVARFVNENRDIYILVHCDAGISRSAGVAAAILKHYTGDDTAIFKSGRFYPNMWCYRKTLNALHELFPPKGKPAGNESGDMLITQQSARLLSLRQRLLQAIANVEYEGKERNRLDGTIEVSCAFPGIAYDPMGTQSANEWEIQLTCHFDPERPYMTWWATSLEEALSECEREVDALIGRMEEAAK